MKIISQLGLASVILVLTVFAILLEVGYSYGSGFSSSRSDGLSLVAGSDTTNSCSSFPCAEAQVSSANDFASLSLSIFPSSVKKAQQPETYYTDLLDLKNNGNIARTVNAISISSVNDSSSILGSLSIFFCPVQNNTPSKLICAYLDMYGNLFMNFRARICKSHRFNVPSCPRSNHHREKSVAEQRARETCSIESEISAD